jgi:hypothetical protein
MPFDNLKLLKHLNPVKEASQMSSFDPALIERNKAAIKQASPLLDQISKTWENIEKFWSYGLADNEVARANRSHFNLLFHTAFRIPVSRTALLVRRGKFLEAPVAVLLGAVRTLGHVWGGLSENLTFRRTLRG